LNVNRTLALTNTLEGAGNHLSKQFLRYWSQNKHLQMKFDVREGKPEDPPEMRAGPNIWGKVYDSVHWATTDLGSRSRGFVWFFSFLAWYEDVKRRDENVILLLDEPGLFTAWNGSSRPPALHRGGAEAASPGDLSLKWRIVASMRFSAIMRGSGAYSPTMAFGKASKSFRRNT
jgi:hypothetical protein